jgi:hypothetical protein
MSRRVDLDRQVVAGVQHLDEDGETRMVFVTVTENLLAVGGPKLMERFSGKRSFIDDGLLSLTIYDFPGLAEGTNGIGQAAVVDAFKFASAPDAFHVEGFEGDRIHEGD